jgi:tetratricopeptide (TPR) repeat protein
MKKLLPICQLFFCFVSVYAQENAKQGNDDHLRHDSDKVYVKMNMSGEGKTYKRSLVDSLQQKLRSTAEDTAKVSLLLNIARELDRTGTPDQTSPYANQGRTLAEALLASGKYKDNVALKKKLARLINVQAIVVSKKGRIKEGLELFNQSLKMYESIGDKQGILLLCNNIGTTYWRNGESLKATQYLLKSLKMAEELHDSLGIGLVYFNLCNINTDTKDYEKALEYGQKSLKIRQSINDLLGIAHSLDLIGSVYYYNHNYNQALEYHFKALAIQDSIGLGTEVGHTMNNIANVYTDMGKYELARSYFREAIDIYQANSDSINMVRTIGNLGRTLYYTGAFEEARKMMAANVERVKWYKQNDVLEGSYLFLMKCDSALGNFEEALKYEKLHGETVFENMETDRLAKLNELQLKYESEKKAADNLALVQQNEIQRLELSKTRYYTILSVALVLFVSLFVVLGFRQRKLKAEREALQLEQKLLRLQMNPHFIFNSLQAIQNYILKHDEKSSIKYLSSFASLTRAVLENSRFETISLQKEIALLKHYLQLQKLRFGNRFEYEIRVAPDIDPTTIMVPPMLSQPFIENAIEHGMEEVENDGKIDVRFSLQDNKLVMEIVDNGKGMSAKGRAKEHSSLAMEITRERIYLLNRKTKGMTIAVNDAYENKENRRGVRINLSIPLQPSV